MIRTTVPLALFVAVAPAQSLVSPAAFASIEGNQFDASTLTGTTNVRYLQVNGDTTGTPRVIRGVTFRRDGVTVTPAAAFSMTVNAWMSTAASSPGTPSTTFDSNHGPDKVQVLSFRVVNLPATSSVLPLPCPFEYAIAFDTPFSYAGVGPLAFEFQVLGRSNTSAITLDAARTSSTNPLLTQVPFGLGCKGTGRTNPMAVTVASTMSWANGTGNLNVTGAQAPAGAPVIIVIGINNRSWSGIPLPFPLPGSDTNPSGVCTLYNDLFLAIPTVANAAGATPTLAIPIPATTEFAGASVFTQLWALDAPASLGLITSNAAASHWVPPFTSVPVGRVSSNNNASATGSATANSGLVTRFQQ